MFHQDCAATTLPLVISRSAGFYLVGLVAGLCASRRPLHKPSYSYSLDFFWIFGGVSFMDFLDAEFGSPYLLCCAVHSHLVDGAYIFGRLIDFQYIPQ